MSRPQDIQILEDQWSSVDCDVKALLTGLTAEQGALRPSPAAWSIAECLDHLAITNRVYIAAMQAAAIHARARGRLRKGPALPGRFGRWFVGTLEPPVKPRTKMKAPKAILPGSAPVLSDAAQSFSRSHQEVRAFLLANADLDLAGIVFTNPLLRIIHFSLATGLNNILAHERRHLWQARRVRQLLEGIPLDNIST